MKFLFSLCAISISITALAMPTCDLVTDYKGSWFKGLKLTFDNTVSASINEEGLATDDNPGEVCMDQVKYDVFNQTGDAIFAEQATWGRRGFACKIIGDTTGKGKTYEKGNVYTSDKIELTEATSLGGDQKLSITFTSWIHRPSKVTVECTGQAVKYLSSNFVPVPNAIITID